MNEVRRVCPGGRGPTQGPMRRARGLCQPTGCPGPRGAQPEQGRREPFRKAYDILVIEDDEMNMDMITERSELWGYRVAAAARPGIALAREGSPDLIPMDKNLLDVNGRVATRGLKSDAATRRISFAASTELAMGLGRDRGRESGRDGCESKPIDSPRVMWKTETPMTRRVSP